MPAAHELTEANSLKTKGEILYRRVAGPRMSITRDEERVTETILLNASDVQAFRLEAQPPPFFFFSGDSFVPRYRRMPGAEWLITEQMDFRPQSDDLPGDPYGADSGAADDTYDDHYLCDITYRPWLEGGDDERDAGDPESFLEVQKTAGGQFLSIPPTNTTIQEISSPGELDDDVKLPDGSTTTEDAAPVLVNNDLQHGMVIQIPTVEYTLTWPLVLNPLFDRLEKAMGKVNDASLPIFDSSPPETVLFMGYSARRRYVWDGESSRAQPWELQYHFSKRAVNRLGASQADDDDSRVFGWNHEFSPTKGDWVLIKTGSGRKLHDSTNFLQLFLTR